MCSEMMPSPIVTYHDTPTHVHHNLPNMVQHRNNYSNICQQQINNRYGYDESDDISNQPQPQYQLYYNPAQIQHTTMNEIQQEADQHTIELRMNNLGNENIG